jgi:hypothetical protein
MSYQTVVTLFRQEFLGVGGREAGVGGLLQLKKKMWLVWNYGSEAETKEIARTLIWKNVALWA